MNVYHPDRCNAATSLVWVSGAFIVSITFLFADCHVCAQPPADTPTMRLNLEGEIEIQVLVDLVSQRLGINILYDEQVAQKRLSVRAPEEIPVNTLLTVLESALKMKGLALIDADPPGWKRIVVNTELPKVAPDADAKEAIEKYGRGTAVTQAFVLKRADPQQVDTLIKSFLTEGANSVALPESRTLIVTDYASNLLRIAHWIEVIDRPRPDVVTEFVQIDNVEASTLAGQITQILAAQAKAEGVTEEESTTGVSHDPRTNQILLIGQLAAVHRAKTLIQALDVPLDLYTQTYSFANVAAERIDRLVKQLIDPVKVSRVYRSAIDRDENMLIVTTTKQIHEQLRQLQQSRDVAPGKTQSPLRFYKIKNLPVTELLDTIRAVEQQSLVPSFDPLGGRLLGTDGRIRRARTTGAVRGVVPGPNQMPAVPGQLQLPLPPSYQPPQPSGQNGENATPVRDAVDSAQFAPLGVGTDDLADEIQSAEDLLGRARVTADIHTNTLIVIGEPAVHRLYAELIERLDKRRPQVLIESQFVVIDTSDDSSLGVEFSTGDRSGSKRALAFTSFGLSEVDPETGALSIIPGLGFNGTVVDAEVADVVIRALASHRRSRVLSAPRVVVNDNATGQLTSVAEVPFTSVNASNTVATTSFAGFAEAGTTITVTPRISEDDYLQLDFTITQNTFTGPGSEGVPPPRQTDEVTSQITIPDGHTVIVGGLKRRNNSQDVTSIPYLEQIPLVRDLVSLQTAMSSESSLFVFIRPVILRDDKFKELKFLSERDACQAGIHARFPTSEPVLIR